MDKGEERLLVGVESGRIPLTVAMQIVAAKTDSDMQQALQEAYESGQLKGGELLQARRIIERRRAYGAAIGSGSTRHSTVTTHHLVSLYQREVQRQRLLVRKSDFAQQKFLFIIEALRQLLADESFVNLLRAEGLQTMPKPLAERVWPVGVAS
jgi:ParB family chromosome partitioning protein